MPSLAASCPILGLSVSTLDDSGTSEVFFRVYGDDPKESLAWACVQGSAQTEALDDESPPEQIFWGGRSCGPLSGPRRRAAPDLTARPPTAPRPSSLCPLGHCGAQSPPLRAEYRRHDRPAASTGSCSRRGLEPRIVANQVGSDSDATSNVSSNALPGRGRQPTYQPSGDSTRSRRSTPLWGIW